MHVVCKLNPAQYTIYERFPEFCLGNSRKHTLIDYLNKRLHQKLHGG